MISPERDSQIKQVAMDAVRAKIFTSLYVPKEEYVDRLPRIFLPLGKLSELEYRRLMKSEPVMFYEYYSKTTGKFYFGFPVFPSVRMLDSEEYGVFKKYVLKIREIFMQSFGEESKGELEF